MPNETSSQTSPTSAQHYAIRIKGQLDPCWSEWFGGLTITLAGAERDETFLSGPVTDQAALHGILNQIGSLGLTLIAVYSLDSHDEPPSAREPGSPNPGELDLTKPVERVRKPQRRI